MSKEAWLDTGNCAECRRKPYCKKQCARARQREWAYKWLSVASFAEAKMIREQITDVPSMKAQLMQTETWITGEANANAIEEIYSECYNLAVHSRYTVYTVVSVLCANCTRNHVPLKAGMETLERDLRTLELYQD